MQRAISKEEANARLDLAVDIQEKFPFLKDHFHIYSSVKLDEKMNEVGVLEVDIFNKNLDGSEFGMQMSLSKHLKAIITEGLYQQNKKLRKINKELTLKLKKYENEVPKRSNQTASKIITSPNG